MNKNFLKRVACALSLVCCLAFASGCNSNNAAQQPEEGASGEINYTGSITMANANINDNDLYTEWENEDYTGISLNGGSIAIDGVGAKADGSTLTITAKGTYVLSGTLTDGVILVDAQDTDCVRIVLNGADITCSNGAPFLVQSADKVILSLPGGTDNTLTDGESYTYSYYDDTEAEPSAALFSKDDLVINGSGTLTVNGNCNDAIAGNDSIKITGGTLVLNAIDDGIVGKDMVAIQDADIAIDVGGDGIKSTNATDGGMGFIAVADGQFVIASGADALQAETCLYIEGGTFNISTGGGSGVSSSDADSDWGSWGGRDHGGGQPLDDADESADGTSASAKALKATSKVDIIGGTFTIDSSDDAIHCNGIVVIAGGTFTISSGDDGIHADTSIGITGGTINISKSYEGIESALVNIAGGTIDVTAGDDGVNIAGGNDASSVSGRAGQNSFESSGGESLNISGGTLVVNACGDGLDSNGSVYISGGSIFVSGPTNSGNGTLDYSGVFEVSGGTLVGAGSAGMAQAPSSGTTQYTIAGSLTSVQSANTTVSLVDEDGNEILSFTSPKAYQHVVFSSSGIRSGETYTILVDGSAVQEATVSSVVTTFNGGNDGNIHRP